MKTDVIPSSTRLIFPSTAPNLVRGLFAAALGVFALCATAQAIDVIKANNTTALNDNASWTTSVPTSSEVAVWNNTVTSANTSSMGANLSFGGIKVTGTLSGAIGVSGVNTGSVTADSTTDTFTYSGSTVSNGNVVTFSGAPTGLTTGRAYYVINATATTYQISETLGGSIVNFTANTTMTNNVQWILTLGASGIVVDGSRSLSGFSNAVSMSANQTWSVASGKVIDSNANTNNAGIVVFNNGNTLTVDGAGTVDLGAFYGAGGITKNGTGTLNMYGTDNTFTGNVVLNDGTLNAGTVATTLGSGASTLTLNGGTLTAKSAFAQNYGRNTTVAGNATFYNNNSNNTGGQAYTLGTLSIGANTFTVTHNTLGAAGNLTFGATTLTGNATFDVSTRTDNSLILGAVGESGGARGFTKNGVGALTLNGTNTYTGTTTLNQGTLSVGTAGTLSATTAALSVNNSNSSAAGTATVLNLSTVADTTVGSLSGTIATPLSGTNTATINTGGSGRNFTVNQTTSGSYAGVIAGAGNFALGSGSNSTLTLAGANSYTGTTTVSSGTLLINGSQSSATGLVSVSASAALGGNGTIGGAITVANNGILRPGTALDSTTTLTLNNTNLTISGLDSKINLDIAGTADGSFDKIAGIAAFAQSGDITFTLSESYVAGNSWNVFGFTGNSGNFDTIALAGSYSGNLTRSGSLWTNTNIGGQSWKFDEALGTLSVVPEPATWALLAFSLTTVMVLRRRRQG